MRTAGFIANKPLWIAVGAVTVVVGISLASGRWLGGGDEAPVQGARVRRGPLRISVLQRGELAAKNNVSIKSEIEGQTTILQLVREGTMVKPGDMLVRLDSADLVERELQQRIAVDNAQAAYLKAKAQHDIQVSQNLSDIADAERTLQFAEIDIKKYQEGDREQLIKQAQDEILLARQKRTQAENTLTWSKTLHEKGFLTQTELDRDDLDFQSADVQLKQADLALKLLNDYDDPRRQKELDADVVEARRGLERAKLQADARIADFQAALKTTETRLKLEQEKLSKYQTQLEKTRIVAPVAGMVVYTRTEGGRMGGGEAVQEGTQVREGQEILSIPSTGGMIAQASIHESVLQQVATGLSCTIRVDAMPGQELHGKVQFVALLPDKGNWWANPNQRVYRTEVSIDDATADMRPGMNCSIEILVEEIADTLFVPLQSIVLSKGETVAFVAQGGRPEERKVAVGKQSDKWVQILSGLSEGEEVLLAPPAGFSPGKAPESERPQKNGEAEAKGGEAVEPPKPAEIPAGEAVPGRARRGARGDRAGGGQRQGEGAPGQGEGQAGQRDPQRDGQPGGQNGPQREGEPVRAPDKDPARAGAPDKDPARAGAPDKDPARAGAPDKDPARAGAPGGPARPAGSPGGQ